jgi:hypothetical protein
MKKDKAFLVDIIPEVGVEISGIILNIYDYQKDFAPEFLDLLRQKEEVYGVVFTDGNVFISDCSNHLYITTAAGHYGYKDDDEIGRFQLEYRACEARYHGEGKINYISLVLRNADNLNVVSRFLGIDREWVKAAHQLAQEESTNDGVMDAGEYFDRINPIDTQWLQGLFDYRTTVMIVVNQRKFVEGSFTSINLDVLGERIAQESGESANQPLNMALVFDPLTEQIVEGEHHSQAAENLGYWNTRVIFLEYWDEETASNLPDFFPGKACILVRGNSIGWEFSHFRLLAKALIKKGISPDFPLLYKEKEAKGFTEVTLARFLPKNTNAGSES